MLALLVFAFIAGAGTALSPCVLPVLPIALSAGATGGKRRPSGVAWGLLVTFTFTIVAAAHVIASLGLPDDLLRTLAIAMLLLIGVVLVTPRLAARVAGTVGRLTARAGGVRSGDGFWSGAVVGGALGLVYAPCAGPILASVIIVSSAQPMTSSRVLGALAYAAGAAGVLHMVMIGGRRLVAPIIRRGARVQVAMGAVMVVMALVMLGGFDLRFQTALANHVPAAVVNPTGGIERSGLADDAIAELRGGASAGIGSRAAELPTPVQELAVGSPGRLRLPVIGFAPEIVAGGRWFNTPGDHPLSIAGLRGRVVLVDFWTYSCINCVRTLPHRRALYERYGDQGLTIIGVHTPEFPFERDAGNLADAITREGLRYPVVQDNDAATWRAFDNRYWPAVYIIDTRGRVRFAYFGEGGYSLQERVVRTLLGQEGDSDLGPATDVRVDAAAPGVETPESYLGAQRAHGFVNGPITEGARDFGDPPAPGRNEPAFGGRWEIARESATAGAGARLDVRFVAQRVFAVLGADDGPRRMRVLVDGRPIPPDIAGADLTDGVVTIDGQRLYDLVHLGAVDDRVLTLVPERGVTGYVLSFG